MELHNISRRYADVLIKLLVATVGVLVLFFCFKGINTAVTRKVDHYNNFSPSAVTADLRLKELDCLTKNIYWEAAGEPFEGKVAVAQVTVNRTNHPSFPSSICEVVYQRTSLHEKVVCQFSWFCERTHTIKPVYKPEYDQAALVAKKVLLENFRMDSLKDALYFHNDNVTPRWRKQPVAKIGRHTFYKG